MTSPILPLCCLTTLLAPAIDNQIDPATGTVTYDDLDVRARTVLLRGKGGRQRSSAAVSRDWIRMRPESGRSSRPTRWQRDWRKPCARG